MINIKRVSKVVKGGKRMKLSATVVVGDGKGMVGLAHGKASEVAIAVRKASDRARKSMVKIMVAKHTIPHETYGKFGASRVILKPASEGTGLIAPPQIRAVLEACGLRDVLTKSLGSNNPYNLAMATLKALSKLRSLPEIAKARNKPIGYFIERRDEGESKKGEDS